MVVTIDGSSRFSISFNYLLEDNLFFDVLLTIQENQPADQFEGLNLRVEGSPEARNIDDESIFSGESLHYSTVAGTDASGESVEPNLERNHWERYSHKVLLSKHSNCFREWLKRAWNELETRPIADMAVIEDDLFRATLIEKDQRRFIQIDLKNGQSSSLDSILNYIYTGELKFEAENFKILIEDAHTLGFKFVKELCEEYLLQELTSENWASVISCSHYSQNDVAINRCFNFLKENIHNGEFFSGAKVILPTLPSGVMDRLMSSDHVDESNADKFFEIILLWVKADEYERQTDLHGLMERKIGLVSVEFLFHKLANQEVIRSDLDSLRLVTAALQSKMASLSTISTPMIESGSQVDTSDYNRQNDETLLVIENNGLQRFHQKLDPQTNKWTDWMKKHLGEDFGVAVVDEQLLVIGGWKDGEAQSSVEIFNFVSKQWGQGPKMSNARFLFGCCVVNGASVFVCGGTSNKETTAACEMLQLDGSASWMQMPPMSTARYKCSAAFVNNSVYVIGGCTEKRAYSLSMESFDITSNRWSTRSGMKGIRLDFAMTTHQDMIYVFGGLMNGPSDSCERYDPTTDTWQSIRNLPSPRYGSIACLLANKIHIIGGKVGGVKQLLCKSTEVYDIEKDEYFKGAELKKVIIDGTKCVAVKKRYLLQ